MGVEEYNKERLERLKEHKVAFDQEAMWATLQKKKKKRRGAIFLFTMALVALAIVFWMWFPFGTPSDVKMSSAPHNPNMSSSTTEVNAIVDKEDDRIDLSKSDSILHDALLSDMVIARDKNTSEVNSQTKENVEILPSSRGVDGEIDLETSIEEADHQRKRISENIAEFIPITDLDNSNSNELSPANIHSNTDESVNHIEEKVQSKSTSSRFFKLQYMELPFMEEIFRDKVIIPKDALSNPPQVEVVVPSPIWSIGGYVGGGLAFRTLNLEIENPSKVLEELSFGGEVKYQISPRYFLRSGLEYWHNTERKENVTGEIFNLEEQDNESLGFAEDQKGIVIRLTKNRNHRIYQSLQVPFLVGLNTVNERWNMFAEAGIYTNIYRAQRGLLSENEEAASGISIIPALGAGASYRINHRWELFSRMNYRGASPATVDGEGLTVRSFSGLRAQLGVRVGL